MPDHERAISEKSVRPVEFHSFVFGTTSQTHEKRRSRSAIRRYRSHVAVVSVESVLSQIAVRPDTDGIRLVAVDGPSGSGKSTVARRLSAAANAPVVECDDFVSWQDFAGWWPRFERDVLDPLVRGEDAHFRVRDWDNDEFGMSLNGFKRVEWAPLVIMEGVTSARAAGGSRIAYRIWVEAPETLRLQRGIERDGETHRALWVRWMEEERRFFTEDGTRDLADLRVNGAPTQPHDPVRELVVDEL